jgi:hypothetical protein
MGWTLLHAQLHVAIARHARSVGVQSPSHAPRLSCRAPCSTRPRLDLSCMRRLASLGSSSRLPSRAAFPFAQPHASTHVDHAWPSAAVYVDPSRLHAAHASFLHLRSPVSSCLFVRRLHHRFWHPTQCSKLHWISC